MEETAYFALGCFWGPEYNFSKIKGVLLTEVGYSGGDARSPTYEEVCSGGTGHVETVKIVFDQKIIGYEELLKEFWKMHNPAQSDGQGPDIGDQYKSAIFYTSEKKKREAEKSKEKEQKKHKDKITTLIIKFKEFWRAEEYHQNYIKKTGRFVC